MAATTIMMIVVLEIYSSSLFVPVVSVGPKSRNSRDLIDKLHMLSLILKQTVRHFMLTYRESAAIVAPVTL